MFFRPFYPPPFSIILYTAWRTFASMQNQQNLTYNFVQHSLLTYLHKYATI
nr:MAG TPA: hypothetical protein [Caudoviricetes sp.]